MASSSSSTPLPKYDVFLSFRGEDTRNNIVSHLENALKTKKIETFIDNRLKRGDEISPALIRAIEQSKISIIIFSKNYADSRWCLDELVKILECRKKLNQTVIPVFYKVEPRDVRKQTGKFGTAFDRLIWNIPLSELVTKEQIWRNSLKRAGNLSGHSFNNRSEATLIDTIKADVLEKLKNSSNNACDNIGLVGIDSRIEKILFLLDIESPEIRMVGIWGMGGIGKTTIAGQVFNKISSNFDSSCFLKDVREHVNKEGLPSMRNKLISQLLKDEKLEIHTPRIGDGFIKDRLSRTKVLVVLDDVDNPLQLQTLIGEHGTNHFGPGSRVIITTRNKHVLEAHDITCVYDMQMLDDRDALELFRFYAFRQNQPSELYWEISEEFVKYAKGVPLALKVLGSSLRGKVSIGHWTGELKKLKRIPNKEISEMLKISYDSLSEEEKDIFLDISCFFKGMDVNRVRNVLDGCYVSSHAAMEALIDKSLINIAYNWKCINVVEMHDLVEEMGWNIGSRSRLCRDEDVRDVLTKNTGTHKIKAILYDFGWRHHVKMINLDPQAFAKMHNLKFLKIKEFYKDGRIELPRGLESFPEGLMYLYWQSYPLEYLPPTFNPTNLVELHLTYSPLKRLWRGKQDLFSLKVLHLEECGDLIELPDLSSAVNIEELKLICCMDNLPSSIKNLSSLKYLHLEKNNGLREIPSLQQLTSLERLNLSMCHNLTNISSSIGYLKNLTHLDLMLCTSLTNISSSIQYLKKLTHLNLQYCWGLNEIPSSIQHLHSLTYFRMDGCTKITKLPNLPQNIKFLLVDGILIELNSLLTHNPFGHLTNLVQLEMWNCTRDQRSSIFLEKVKLLVSQDCIITTTSIEGRQNY